MCECLGGGDNSEIKQTSFPRPFKDAVGGLIAGSLKDRLLLGHLKADRCSLNASDGLLAEVRFRVRTCVCEDYAEVSHGTTRMGSAFVRDLGCSARRESPVISAGEAFLSCFDRNPASAEQTAMEGWGGWTQWRGKREDRNRKTEGGRWMYITPTWLIKDAPLCQWCPIYVSHTHTRLVDIWAL